MNFILIIISLAIAMIVLYLLRSKVKTPASLSEINRKSNSPEAFPLQTELNDKLVIIKRISQSDLERVLKSFCHMYNEEKFKAHLRLTKFKEQGFAITFPYNIDFETFCYLINYLKYPMELNWSPDVSAWATTKSSDLWITENIANKRVMLFIPSDDTDHDNVYITTKDNQGYKLGFGLGDGLQHLITPKIQFVDPDVSISGLANKEYEDFK